MPNKTRKMPSLRVSGSFRPNTVDLEKRTIEVSFTTGQAGKRYDWWNDIEYLEELDVTPESVRTERLDKGLSVIDSHRSHGGVDGVFGITEEYRFENGEMIGTVRFATDADSDIKFQKAADGILRHVSLGYKVHKYLKSRGENDKLDTYRAVDWEPTELSFVPVSFETTNGVRAEQRENTPTYEVEIVNKEEVNMTPEQRARLALLSSMTTRSDAENQELTSLTALSRAISEPAPVAEPVRTEPVAVAATVAVAAPVDTAAVRTEERANLEPMLQAAEKAGLTPEFATRAFMAGTSVNQFRENVINELGNADSKNIIRNQGVDLRSDNRPDAKEGQVRAATNSLLQRCGVTIENDDREATRIFTGYTLHDMARHFVEASGVSTMGMSRAKIAARAFNSTSDMPLILENVMNKNLQAAYQQTPQTFRDLGRRTTVNDFREKHAYRLGDAPSLKRLGENGEYKSGSLSESKERYAIETFARKIAFTRKMLINDDMSALDMLPRAFGQSGANLESDVVWGLILNYDFMNNRALDIKMEDGKSLFHTDHGNLLTGAASALSQDSLSALRKLGRKQKTLDGNFMNVQYQNLVVPEDIETVAEKLLFGNFQANNTADTNPFLNKMGLRVEPRLSVVSETAWLGFSNMADTFEYAYLAGEEEMYTEVNTETDIDGLEIKVRKDFGAGLIDSKGFAKANGAA